jgi:hypothetical protein
MRHHLEGLEHVVLIEPAIAQVGFSAGAQLQLPLFASAREVDASLD